MKAAFLLPVPADPEFRPAVRFHYLIAAAGIRHERSLLPRAFEKRAVVEARVREA